MNLIRRRISDWHVLNMTALWLKAGRKYRKQAIGVPLGGVLSPLWANIYLHPLDAWLSGLGFKMVRYADDFLVLCASENDARRFPTKYLGSMGLKILIYIIFIAVFLAIDTKDAVPFLVSFLVSYATFTIVEVAAMLRYQKRS